MTELRRNVAVRIAPVREDETHAMIAGIVELRALAGFRNLPRGDLAALARALSALSALDDVAEAGINPLIVRGEGLGAGKDWARLRWMG